MIYFYTKFVGNGFMHLIIKFKFIYADFFFYSKEKNKNKNR